MSGGQFGARGYLYQATVCLLDSLMNKNWDFVQIEPDSRNEKVDISWELNGKIVKAMQVKSSINLFKKWQIKKWICDLVEDSLNANVYEVVLIGKCSPDAQKFVEAINACHEDVFRSRLKKYKSKILVRINDYNYESSIDSINMLLHEFYRGKSYDIGSSAIKLISRASIFDYMKFSTQGSKISKEELGNLLIKSAKSVKINSSDKVIDIEFNKSKEEIPKRQINIKEYIFKLVLFLMLLVIVLITVRNYSNNLFKMIMPQVDNQKILFLISIFICCISLVSIIAILNISNFKFLEFYDEYYPVLSIRQLETYYDRYIKAIVTETRLRKDRLVFVDHEVEIFNLTDEVINFCDSTFEGISKEYATINEDFYITRLQPGNSEVVYKKTILRQWDFPEEVQYKFNTKLNLGHNDENEEITLSTPRLIKTFFLELNYFNYIRILKYKIPFEISWIKEKLKFIRWWYEYKPFKFTRILAILGAAVIIILTIIGCIKMLSLLTLFFVMYSLTNLIVTIIEKIFSNHYVHH